MIMRNHFVNKLFWNLIVLFIIFQTLFLIFGYQTTIFWFRKFIHFSVNKVLSLFGSELDDFGETSFMMEWRIISFEEFLHHLAQSYKCLSEVSSLEDLVLLDENLYLGEVYAPTKAATIIFLIFYLTLVFFAAWSEIQGEYPRVMLFMIWFSVWLAIEELGFGLGSTLAFSGFLIALLIRAIMNLIHFVGRRRRG